MTSATINCARIPSYDNYKNMTAKNQPANARSEKQFSLDKDSICSVRAIIRELTMFKPFDSPPLTDWDKKTLSKDDRTCSYVLRKLQGGIDPRFFEEAYKIAFIIRDNAINSFDAREPKDNPTLILALDFEHDLKRSLEGLHNIKENYARASQFSLIEKGKKAEKENQLNIIFQTYSTKLKVPLPTTEAWMQQQHLLKMQQNKQKQFRANIEWLKEDFMQFSNEIAERMKNKFHSVSTNIPEGEVVNQQSANATKVQFFQSAEKNISPRDSKHAKEKESKYEPSKLKKLLLGAIPKLRKIPLSGYGTIRQSNLSAIDKFEKELKNQVSKRNRIVRDEKYMAQFSKFEKNTPSSSSSTSILHKSFDDFLLRFNLKKLNPAVSTESSDLQQDFDAEDKFVIYTQNKSLPEAISTPSLSIQQNGSPKFARSVSSGSNLYQPETFNPKEIRDLMRARRKSLEGKIDPINID